MTLKMALNAPVSDLAKSEPVCVLIGGGHAHVAVLADWIRRGLPSGEGNRARVRPTLLTPHPTLRYSGMVPGWISGEHPADAGLVDLVALANAAGVQLVQDRCVGIDHERRIVKTEAGAQIPFDFASIDTGGVGRARAMLGEDQRLLDIRPIDRFVDQVAQFQPAPGRIAVIGGGAGGVELVFALRNASLFDGAAPDATLVAGAQGILPGFSSGVRGRVTSELAAQAITIIEQDAVLADGVLSAGGQSLEPVDMIIAALGSGAPEWPMASGLDCDTQGFIAVDQYQRSLSHPRIFAAGDVALRTDTQVPHSGVHAVHAGPVLAANLRAVLEGGKPIRSHQPRPASLYLLSTGNGSAIASYGRLSAQGRWVARLKRWIDRRWITSYAHLTRQV
ncbi:MAG: FAD-dependent oxidoreductase [Pseudomonadota bacterium]